MGRYLFKLPDVGEGIAEAEIVAWHVKPGDRIEEDDPLLDVMTDKATVEITSPISGEVVAVDGEPGAQAAIGSVVAILDVADLAADPEPMVEAFTKSATPPPAPETSPSPPSPVEAPRLRSPRPSKTRTLASPAVRQRALDLGVRLELVSGSGPAGRVQAQDLEAYVTPPPSPIGPAAFRRREGVESIRVIGLRRRIAERMAEAKRRIPHFSYIEEVDVTDLEKLRGQLNGQADRPRLTILPFLTRALVRTLPAFPQINATYDDEAGIVHRHAAVHLGVAAQTTGGLVVPVLRHAETYDLWGSARAIAQLAQAARSGKATREDLSGSTITVTSLGPLGGLATTPVINHPEVAIIGPNRIVERPMIVSGEITVRKVMNLSCSFDHRVVDGWDAAEFVQQLKRLLETPALLLVEPS